MVRRFGQNLVFEKPIRICISDKRHIISLYSLLLKVDENQKPLSQGNLVYAIGDLTITPSIGSSVSLLVCPLSIDLFVKLYN